MSRFEPSVSQDEVAAEFTETRPLLT